ncbi:hypothetical protein PVAP13_8KG257401 [Panicum virgatum]|uniref:Uncharacterized protein n=1 Tax=Panicum virgatum TaxID=38727 RepID=A0A8T0PWI9_PANVG|nr:hypothetical protein PVAP13_8KG257401 [Panicum virgatum]
MPPRFTGRRAPRARGSRAAELRAAAACLASLPLLLPLAPAGGELGSAPVRPPRTSTGSWRRASRRHPLPLLSLCRAMAEAEAEARWGRGEVEAPVREERPAPGEGEGEPARGASGPAGQPARGRTTGRPLLAAGAARGRGGDGPASELCFPPSLCLRQGPSRAASSFVGGPLSPLAGGPLFPRLPAGSLAWRASARVPRHVVRTVPSLLPLICGKILALFAFTATAKKRVHTDEAGQPGGSVSGEFGWLPANASLQLTDEEDDPQHSRHHPWSVLLPSGALRRSRL